MNFFEGFLGNLNIILRFYIDNIKLILNFKTGLSFILNIQIKM